MSTFKQESERKLLKTDAVLNRAEQVLLDPSAVAVDLVTEYKIIVESYRKLHHKLHKSLLISDSYQSQLRTFNERLELMARTDLLTGLSSRWEMASRIEIEKSRYERHKSTFSIVMADVDKFKTINDSFGHLAGDRVLREIATRIKSNCRAEDICARWGGDEFMILLPETNLQNAAIVAEKIAASVQKTPIKWEQQDIRVSVSVGVGEFKAGSSINNFLQEVDNSLYADKKAGRVIYPP